MRDINEEKNAKCNLAQPERGQKGEDVKMEGNTSFESRQRSTVEALESEMSETLKHKTGKMANG